MTEKANHYSQCKLGIDQIPAECQLELGLVYSYGEHKYDRDNWKKGTEWHEFIGSAKRHLLAWELGEERDPESGCHHLAHVAWNAFSLMFFEMYGLGTDDRPNAHGAFLNESGDNLTPMDYARKQLADGQERAAAYHAGRDA